MSSAPTGRWTLVPAVLGLAVLVGPAPANAGTARTTARTSAAAPARCVQAHTVYQGTPPWSSVRLDPTRVWPLSTGRGVTVAVVATGVDAGNGQFRAGQVEDGFDALTGRPGATTDCDGRGTFTAGLIAAQPDPRTAVVGLAPEVRLLPVRVTQSMSSGQASGDARTLAAGIDWARRQDAGVICVTATVAADDPSLHQAVRDALGAGTVVVAGGQPGRGGGSTFPTAQPGVIGVAAVDPSDQPLPDSDRGDHLTVAAPGSRLWSTGAGGPPGELAHADLASGPALAASFVCATAALVRAAHPGLTPAQVAHRIAVTADPTAKGSPDPGLGAGVVNPYRAVSAVLPEESTAVSRAGTAPARPVPALAPLPTAASTAPARAALTVVLAGLVTAAAAVTLTTIARRGAARRWRPGRRPRGDRAVR